MTHAGYVTLSTFETQKVVGVLSLGRTKHNHKKTCVQTQLFESKPDNTSQTYIAVVNTYHDVRKDEKRSEGKIMYISSSCKDDVCCPFVRSRGSELFERYAVPVPGGEGIVGVRSGETRQRRALYGHRRPCLDADEGPREKSDQLPRRTGARNPQPRPMVPGKLRTRFHVRARTTDRRPALRGWSQVGVRPAPDSSETGLSRVQRRVPRKLHV